MDPTTPQPQKPEEKETNSASETPAEEKQVAVDLQASTSPEDMSGISPEPADAPEAPSMTSEEGPVAPPTETPAPEGPTPPAVPPAPGPVPPMEGPTPPPAAIGGEPAPGPQAPTPPSAPKPPRNSSMMVIVLAVAVGILLLAVAIYAFTKK